VFVTIFFCLSRSESRAPCVRGVHSFGKIASVGAKIEVFEGKSVCHYLFLSVTLRVPSAVRSRGA